MYVNIKPKKVYDNFRSFKNNFKYLYDIFIIYNLTFIYLFTIVNGI